MPDAFPIRRFRCEDRIEYGNQVKGCGFTCYVPLEFATAARTCPSCYSDEYGGLVATDVEPQALRLLGHAMIQEAERLEGWETCRRCGTKTKRAGNLISGVAEHQCVPRG